MQLENDAPAASVRRAVWPGVWPGVMLMVAGSIGFLGIAVSVADQGVLWQLDYAVIDFMADADAPALTTFMTAVTHLSGTLVLSSLIAIGVVVWARLSRSIWDPLLFLVSMAVSTVLALALKYIIARPRLDPSLPTPLELDATASFPSGHTSSAATVVLVAGYLIWRKHHETFRRWMWITGSVVIIVLVGTSRVYLGYHFLTDALAGAVLAVVVLGGVMVFVRWHDLHPFLTRHRRQTFS